MKTLIEGSKTDTKPIYCRNCHSRETWERAQDLDVTDFDTGQVMWEGWRCKGCGATTIIRVGVDK